MSSLRKVRLQSELIAEQGRKASLAVRASQTKKAYEQKLAKPSSKPNSLEFYKKAYELAVANKRKCLERISELRLELSSI